MIIKDWRKKERGFTLIEIIIVVIVLSLIATLVVPNLFKKVESSKRKITKTQIALIENAVKMFKLDVGRYPDTNEGLQALLTQPANADNWDGPYLEKGLPKDPWKRNYIYECPGKHYTYDIFSFGADGELGGEAENIDIVNWVVGSE